MSKQRILVKGNGDDKPAMQRALVAGIKALETIDDLVIVVPTIGHMKHSMLGDLLNQLLPDFTKIFFRDRVLHFPDGKKIQLCASTTLKNFKRSQGYVLMWGTHDTIEEVESIGSCQLIVELSWMETDYKEWERKFNLTIM